MEKSTFDMPATIGGGPLLWCNLRSSACDCKSRLPNVKKPKRIRQRQDVVLAKICRDPLKVSMLIFRASRSR